MRYPDKYWADQLNGKKEPVKYEPGDPFVPRTVEAREKRVACLADAEPTLETLGLTAEDLPTNFNQMSDTELAMVGANITLYTQEQATQLLREISKRRKLA